MSRGIGTTQRKAILALCDQAKPEGIAKGPGIRLTDLKRAIGTDRSNARRAIRGLADRGLVKEVVGEEGERRVKLTSGARLALVLAGIEDKPLALSDVPSRPFDLDAVYDQVDALLDPHGSAEPSWINADLDEPAVSDPAGYPMQTGIPHAKPPRRRERAVSDNEANDPVRGNPMRLGRPHEA